MNTASWTRLIERAVDALVRLSLAQERLATVEEERWAREKEE